MSGRPSLPTVDAQARPPEGTGLRDVGVVIVAGGSGSRTGGTELKQFRWVAGKPMLLQALRAFQAHPAVAMVVCVLPQQYAGDPPPWLFQCDSDRMLLSVGGATRAESVANGLEDLPAECSTVLIHDAARPLVSLEMIDRVVVEARKGHGAIAALDLASFNDHKIFNADAPGAIPIIARFV